MRMEVVRQSRHFGGSLSKPILALRRHHQEPGTGTGSCMLSYIPLMISTPKCYSLIAELACHEKVTTLQDTETGSHGYRVKVFDLERPDLLSFVFYPTLEQISILRLQQEEECSLTSQLSSARSQVRI